MKGAVIGGGMDLVETKAIGERTFKWFFEGNYVYDAKAEEMATNAEIIEVDAEKEED